MSFVFPILLSSLALVGIPVLIHLIMRQKPKTLPFPAFRFLLQRHRTNLRKLRLRHLLLLALRVLLIAAVVMALARPKVSYEGLNITSDQPVAAVLVFDTSVSMEYKATDNVSRLDEAKQRGLELLDELPPGSRVAILDTADFGQSVRAQWFQAMGPAKQRVADLQLKAANASVSQRLENAFRNLAELARDRQDEHGAHLPRLLFVFSDRTRASWEPSRIGALREAGDQVPPTLAGLKRARENLPSLFDQLGSLRQQLPPASGQDYPEQALLDGLALLKDLASGLTREDMPPDAELGKAIDSVRRRARDLSDILQSPPSKREDSSEEKGSAEAITETARAFRTKLLTGLHTILKDLTGVQSFFVDVGIEHPKDLGLIDLTLPISTTGQPQQIFSQDEKFVVSAVVQATGKDKDTLTRKLLLQIGKKTLERQVDVRAGERVVEPFAIDSLELNLEPGHHSISLSVDSQRDTLRNNRFLTFAIREPRQILVLADDFTKAGLFTDTLRDVGFAPELQQPVPPKTGKPYQAVYLIGVKQPSPQLVQWLEEYVRQGGSLGVIPGGDEMDPEAYNGSFQKVLPGKFAQVVQAKPGATWNLGNPNLKNSALHRFWELRTFTNWDFLVTPRRAENYWEVTPQAAEMVLVRYADKNAHPAVLSREVDPKKGKVLQFTTTMDLRKPPWNNYAERLNSSFYPFLIYRCTNYLAGDEEAVQLNFSAGPQEPRVALPLLPRQSTFLLSGPVAATLLPDGAREIVVKQAVKQGNYTVEGDKDTRFRARFSVNVPGQESDLTRMPVEEVEAVLGKSSVLPAHRRAHIRELLKESWNEPMELFPSLMVFLLLALAVENLLANKFYRKENPQPNSGGTP